MVVNPEKDFEQVKRDPWELMLERSVFDTVQSEVLIENVPRDCWALEVCSCSWTEASGEVAPPEYVITSPETVPSQGGRLERPVGDIKGDILSAIMLAETALLNRRISYPTARDGVTLTDWPSTPLLPDTVEAENMALLVVERSPVGKTIAVAESPFRTLITGELITRLPTAPYKNWFDPKDTLWLKVTLPSTVRSVEIVRAEHSLGGQYVPSERAKNANAATTSPSTLSEVKKGF